jgi:hypothetical protein
MFCSTQILISFSLSTISFHPLPVFVLALLNVKGYIVYNTVDQIMFLSPSIDYNSYAYFKAKLSISLSIIYVMLPGVEKNVKAG